MLEATPLPTVRSLTRGSNNNCNIYAEYLGHQYLIVHKTFHTQAVKIINNINFINPYRKDQLETLE